MCQLGTYIALFVNSSTLCNMMLKQKFENTGKGHIEGQNKQESNKQPAVVFSSIFVVQLNDTKLYNTDIEIPCTYTHAWRLITLATNVENLY